MTLLASVNRVLRDLREESLDTLTADDRVLGVVDSLNRGAERVLRYHNWSFLERSGSQAFLPARFAATGGGLGVEGATTVNLNAGAVNSWGSTDAARFSGSVRSRLRFTDDASFANTSYIISNLLTTVNFNAALTTAFRSGSANDITSSGIEVYAHEFVLPSTVRAVTSIRHEEGPLQLVSVGDKHLEFDSLYPRVTDSFSDRPRVAYVGGFASGTTLDGAAATTGLLMTVWPPPDADVVLHYDSVYQHATLSEDTDEWEFVPSEHVTVIEQLALSDQMMNNRQADAERSALLESRARQRLEELKMADRKQPNHRRYLRPYGGHSSARGFRDRWDSQEIDAP